MHQLYEDYLFSQGYLVAAPESTSVEERHPAEVLVALARFAEIRITAHAELADWHMIEVAGRNIGKDVPEPFMRGFPQTARELSPVQLYFDQFIHYVVTYGFGDFSEAGHSLFEEHYERAAFTEGVEPKPFAIITAEEAQALLTRAVEGLLASTRPLNDVNYQLVLRYLLDFGLPTRTCACKDTVCRLLIDTRDLQLANLLVLSDVIRLVEWLLELRYPVEKAPSSNKRVAVWIDDLTRKWVPPRKRQVLRLNKMSLKNQDRKLISAVLDRLFDRGSCDVSTCLEKKVTWKGLLHHIHYRPKCEEARAFCDAVRGNEARSARSEFEQLMQAGDVCAAADFLRTSKGPTAVMRNLNYLLSRCASDDEVDYVLDAAGTDNKIVLLQMLMFLYQQNDAGLRTFRFVRMNKMRKHTESEDEAKRRRSIVDGEVQLRALLRLESQLEKACHGTLGKVYIAETMRNTALPMQEAASMGGFGTLPRGTHLPIPVGKKVRAFVYWEKANDIDLSCFGFDRQGKKKEFSWRTMAEEQSVLSFSGDEVSGYYGGSEYFDVDLDVFREQTGYRYLVFCANVFSWDTVFSECTCRAGYMLRDIVDSGEVFEPKTVKSSFTVNCASHSAFLFAIDVEESDFIWLNIAEESDEQIAGENDISFLLGYMHLIDAVSLYDFARMLASEVVETPEEADVVFSNDELDLRDDQEQIRSLDTARILELMNA